MSIPCPPVIQCVDPPDAQLYALEDPPLPQITCVQGSAPDTVTLSCCGQQNTVDLTGMSATQRRDAINNLVNQCVLSLGFCGVPAPSQLFGNAPQTVITKCPDGTEFSVVTPGCSQITTSQDLSNALARSNAAKIAPICLSGIPQCLCVGSPYSATIQSNGQKQLLTWIVSGTVPPGLTVHVESSPSSTVKIDGTPTQFGNYTFMITAQSSLGNFMVKGYTLSVLQITTPSIPSFAISQPYSFQMQAGGGSGAYAWLITGGALPPGLSMSSSGLISGTPTGLAVNPLSFYVIDTLCESANNIPVPPQIALSAVSTTSIATVLGYPEWPAFTSTPPKKYHQINWSGTSEHQLWVAGTQIGGSRYDYFGADAVDTFGNITSTHTKNFSAQCNGSFGLYCNVQGNAIETGTSVGYSFRGYFGVPAVGDPAFIASNPSLFAPALEQCGSSSIPYAFVGNVAVNGESDSSDLWGSALIQGTSNLGISKFTALSSTFAQSVEAATDNRLATPYVPKLGVIFGGGSTPADFWQGCQVIYNHNYTAVLLDEYTDAEASANANVSTGNSTVAQNFQRTTGFVTTVTTVRFTLTCTNLVAGNTYTVQVELFDPETGNRSENTYTVVATGSISTVVDNIPLPAPGHTTQVRFPKIGMK